MKIFTGRVISTKMEKTATVLVERVVPHPVYKKPVKRAKKYQVHDEERVAKIGQVVRFRDSKPFSKLKKWVLVDNGIKKEKLTKTEKDKVKKVVKSATKEKKPADKKNKKSSQKK